MFMRSAAIFGFGGARRLAAGARRLLAAGRFYSSIEAAGARGLAPSAGEAKGLSRRALTPVGLDAAGLGVASADCKAAS